MVRGGILLLPLELKFTPLEFETIAKKLSLRRWMLC